MGVLAPQDASARIGMNSTDGTASRRSESDLNAPSLGSDLSAADADHLMPEVYSTLRRIAQSYLGAERCDHTLQPTALVHEAYLRLAGESRGFANSPHFLACAATAMRNILVDHARRRSASKRGIRNRTQIAATDSAAFSATSREFEVLELDDLLRTLAAHDSRKARVVELRLFAGMTLDEIAVALSAARSTIASDWAVARAWLSARILGGTHP